MKTPYVEIFNSFKTTVKVVGFLVYFNSPPMARMARFTMDSQAQFPNSLSLFEIPDQY